MLARLWRGERVNVKKIGQNGKKIGLVLGGGAVRGLAHIGVLKVLEKYFINIDYNHKKKILPNLLNVSMQTRNII